MPHQSLKPGMRTGMLALALAALACGSSGKKASGPAPITLAVGSWFTAGTVVKDRYSGRTATVDASGSVAVTPDPQGLILLEKDGASPTPFDWRNAVVYFAMTDRFANGDPANDHAYGRAGDGGTEVGTWHGGDWVGLTQKLDHVQALGATAIWISPIVEQVHGWAAGASGSFKHYGYHGYWARDFTRLDASFGTAAELQGLVDAAHARGIRVLVDVVMNHPGYATGADLVDCLPQVFNDGTGAAFGADYTGLAPPAGKTWNNWNDLVNYGSASWSGWWGINWIRAGLGGGYQTGSGDLQGSLAFLPDFKTESAAAAGTPPILANTCMAGTGFVAQGASATVRDYLVKWHSDWVRQMGFDGFRCDTAKNVELDSWAALKAAATAALADWKTANPAKKIDDAPFWMTGEVFGHGVAQDSYYTAGGFDSLLNFSYQAWVQGRLQAAPHLVDSAADVDGIYGSYANLVSTVPGFDFLSYLSSHDTALFFSLVGSDPALQRQAGTALLLAPGGVQVFYGDETGRGLGPHSADPTQATRSDMNWSTVDASILAHWQKLGSFRRDHAAVGAGTHTRITAPAGSYAFARSIATGPLQDAVVVAITAPN